MKAGAGAGDQGETGSLAGAGAEAGAEGGAEARAESGAVLNPDSAIQPRPLLSICIPAYNRARFLAPLLHSIMAQSVGDGDLEIVIAEDASPERSQIAAIVQSALQRGAPTPIRYSENAVNLGYDGNVRRLVEQARGRWCFFLGNDDLLAPGALAITRAHLAAHPGIGLLLRGYAWFRGAPENIAGTARYVSAPTLFAAGVDAIAMCFRRSGVISGYIVDRDAAFAAATDRFDGTLYYQMHLTASVLATRPALAVPEVLVLCRDGTPPDFGVAAAEQGHFTPGGYTPQARVRMVRGAFEILAAHASPDDPATREVWSRVVRDYARHFYPFVMDQLTLPWRQYLALCRAYASTPVGRHPAFYVNCIVAYALGRRRADALIERMRGWLGRTPRL